MSAPRVILANAIRAVAPASWTVLHYPWEPDAVAKPVVSVFQTEIRPAPLAPVGHFEIALKVYIFVSNDLAPDARENTLDEALGRVLDVVDGAGWLTWASAERTAVNGFPCYEITATAVGEKEA